MNNHKSDKDRIEGPERFGLLGVTKRTELLSMGIFTVSFWGYVLVSCLCYILPKKKNWKENWVENLIETVVETVEHGATFFPVALALFVTYETRVLYKQLKSDKKKSEIVQIVMATTEQLRDESKEDN